MKDALRITLARICVGAGLVANLRRSMSVLRWLLLGGSLTFGAACLGATTYAYDSANRLTNITYGNGTIVAYGYDVAGNLVSRTANGILNVDASGATSKYDALTDGLLVIRHFFGLTGTSLTNGALGGTATRTDPAAIKVFLNGLGLALDIDGNGQVDALTDGLLILRYMFGLRGASLIAGVVDPLGTRQTAADIETYLQSLMP